MKESNLLSHHWLIAFSDLFTLLLTFFILSVVLINEHENNIYVTIEQLLKHTYSYLDSKFEEDETVSLQRYTKGVQITIPSAQLFEENRADIRDDFTDELLQIGSSLKDAIQMKFINDINEIHNSLSENNKKLLVKIRIEGHTDNRNIISGRYRTNLELSSARAVSVVEFFSKNLDIPAEIFSAEGRSKFEPIADNNTEEGRGINRRVEIYIDADIMDDFGLIQK